MLIEEIYVRAAQASAGLTVGQMKMIRKLKTYRHALWFLLYSAFYMTAFSAVEKAGHVHYHVIHTWLDEQIPFCRFFVVPYFLWFGFIGAAVTWFVMCCKNKDEYYKLITMLMMGMTIFIVVSVVYPNRLDLRPAQVEGNDIFAILCRYLYRTDTPTNVLPSIHVYNSMAVCYAVNANETLRRKKWVIAGTDVLTLLIVLSTMFLKQHSVIDVTTGMVMSVVLQVICDHIFETEPERAGADARIYSSKQRESGSRA